LIHSVYIFITGYNVNNCLLTNHRLVQLQQELKLSHDTDESFKRISVIDNFISICSRPFFANQRPQAPYQYRQNTCAHNIKLHV